MNCDEDSFEQFTLEWLYGCKKSKYSSIKRLGEAGVKGEDCKVIWINDYEIELNIQLYAECSKETLDCVAIEELLKKGADPLGATAVSGLGLLDHIYGEILCDSQDSKSINLPRITELFLKYGMDIDNPKIPYDDDNSLHLML